MRTCCSPITEVVVYNGHKQNPLFGPYYSCIEKRISMFKVLNKFREEIGRPNWNVSTVTGEELIDTLKKKNPKRTLLVIPAGPSTKLQNVFSPQVEYLKNDFFNKGGRGYFTCGSTYWASKERMYFAFNEKTNTFSSDVKISNLPLFKGRAIGPLCPFPGKKHYEGYFSDAVTVTDGQENCSICLSGGGSFILTSTTQKVRVVAKYLTNELHRLGKKSSECPAWENAAIMVPVGEGAALLSMFHPYYGRDDIHVEDYQTAFPDSGTDWQAVKEKLSSFDERMRFSLKSMICPLEDAVQ